MSKSVLISIKPQWCELICRGEKTLEVRKTKPKINPPFKCYIYETKGVTDIPTFIDEEGHELYRGWGAVIGEFVCDKILPIMVQYNYPALAKMTAFEIPGTCLTDKEIMEYLGNGIEGYAWHISNLEIYPGTKEISQFYKECKSCDIPYIGDPPCENCKKNKLTRPPQSWCYVEEI